jgi:hypothetical protein
MQAEVPDTGVTVLAKACAAKRSAEGVDTALDTGVRWAKRHLVSTDPDIVLVVFGISEVLDVPGNYRYEPERMADLTPETSGFKDAIVGASQVARRKPSARRRRRTSRLLTTSRGRPTSSA